MTDFASIVKPLADRLDSGLSSVILYGSSAAGTAEEHAGEHDFLILVSTMTASTASSIRDWVISLPKNIRIRYVVMTATEFLQSADVFPVEYSSIRNCYRILHGNDFVAEIDLDPSNLRHQIEYELRAKKQRFISDLIDLGIKDKDLKRSLSCIANSWFVLGSAALVLDEPPADNGSDPLLKWLGLSETDRDFLHTVARGDFQPTEGMVDRLLNLFNRLISKVDEIEK
ncbi:MAG: hypothetical protein PHQ23_09775 [Candidatus Wallbacteria bacterium]|nr:hypothetical protein [Candidatus Wallbacteria bacterium]